MLENRATETEFLAKTRFLFAFCTFLLHELPLIMSPIRVLIKEIQHMSPRWGFRVFIHPVYYTHVAPLGLNAPMHRIMFHTSRPDTSRILALRDFTFRFLSCKSFNPEYPDSDNNYEHHSPISGLIINRSLRCSESRNRHTERRTRNIVQPGVVAEDNGTRLAAVFTADTHLEI